MKTTNLLKIASVILLGLAINGPLQADSDKHTRNVRVNLDQVAHAIKLRDAGIRNMQILLARIDDRVDQPFEDWMFESDYLSKESGDTIESWMLESNYLNEEVQPLEPWMFSETRLSEAGSEKPLESWMFDAGYLLKQGQKGE